MDRPIVYVGELPRSADFLGLAKDALYAIGDLALATLGDAQCAHGLVCAATSPPGLNVTIGPGAIYSPQQADTTAYGSLGIDSNTIVKQGLLTGAAVLTITPPVTSGYSQVYLVEAEYSDTDTSPVILPYFNSNNTLQPLNGPNNTGIQQYTVRAGLCNISLKAGSAAPTESQTAPTVDTGAIPLYLITVANGQTTITSSSFAVHPSAPFIPLTLMSAPAAIQSQSANFAEDIGSATNAISIGLPAYTSFADGTPLRIKKNSHTNSDVVTVSVNGGSAIPVVWADGTPLIAGDWPANAFGNGVYVGATFYLTGAASPTVFANRMGSVSFRSSQTWTVPDGVSMVKRCRVWGGGGGGGGSSGTLQSSCGGGGGGYAEKTNIPVTPLANITVTIGAGGAGGDGAADGSDGGTSTFGSGTPVLASGGGGGTYDSTSFTGGVCGVGSNGDFNISGRYGGPPLVLGSSSLGGIGGAAPFSDGSGRLQITTTGGLDGDNGGFPGCGANGACTGSSGGTQTGGDGAPGLIIIEY